jgi:hypothetical protein
MPQIANLIGGPAEAFIDTGTLASVGHTKGGIKLEAGEPIFMDLGTDLTGQTVVRRIKDGMQPDFINIPVAEETLDNINLAMAGMTLITDSTDATKKRLERRVGSGGSPTETKFVVKPIDPATGIATTDKKKWLTIPKAVAVGSVEVTWAPGEQRIYMARYQAMPEELAGGFYRTFFFGDSTAVAA